MCRLLERSVGMNLESSGKIRIKELIFNLQTFINPQEAYMAKAFLESAGIETRMQDELTVRTGIHAQAIGGVKLLVRHECWQEALKVLEEGFSLIPAGLEVP